jgi:hypothetical protein
VQSPRFSYHSDETGPIKIDKFDPEGETNQAIRFMEDHAKTHGDSPFAIAMNWEPPHWPYDKYPDQFNVYDSARVDLAGGTMVGQPGGAIRASVFA